MLRSVNPQPLNPLITRTTPIDAKIPFLAAALDPEQVYPRIQSIRPDTQRVTTATLIRHKPSRRALIAYQLDTDSGPLALLGKIRAKGTDHKTFHRQKTLWQQGFGASSPDGYCVPEPIGLLPEWQMWFQRCVPGVPATERLAEPGGVALARRIAAIACKLHTLPTTTRKTQTLADELRILHERLPAVSEQFPEWRSRIHQILQDCDFVAATLPQTPSLVGIHRDFYSDQILVDGDRLWLVDLDLYCLGHPALDIGNFIAHITEQSLRQKDNPTALEDREFALQETFIEAFCQSPLSQKYSATDLRQAIAVYTTLTLVRHIHISTRIPERTAYTSALLDLCENRLTVARQ